MRRFIKPALIAVLILCAGIFVKGSIPQPSIGGWLSAGAMTEARSRAASALLQDGRILVTGGDNGSGPLASAEFFDTSGSFAAAPPMSMARSAHSATVLADGRILVAGGSTGAAATNAAEIFDPAANAWTPVAGGMIQARSNQTASLLADGRVLFAGGDNAGAPVAALEIFDPVAGSFSSVGMMSTPRTSFASAVLSDGRVLLIGGSNGSAPTASTEIFDPASNSVSPGPALSAPRMAHSATALIDGRVLVAGGNNGSADVASAEIYDPSTGTFAGSASTLATPRRDQAAFLLPNNGSVIIVGGTSANNDVATAEMFVPSTGTFVATGSPSAARQHATGSPLSQDGILFLAGGSNSTGTLSSAELYGFATVKTDKADYAPGEIVTITGSGWQPGETVSLTMVESPLIDTHGPFTTVADSTGTILNNQFSPDEHDISIRFYLTAVGSVSGVQAQNTFTDAPNDNTSMTVACAPTSILVGQSTSCTATVTNTQATPNNGFPQGTVSWTAAGTAGGSNPTTCTLVQVGASLNSSCSSSFTPTSVGTATVTGNYNRASNLWKANSASSGPITVTKASTTTTITSSLTTPTVVGQVYTVAYTVAAVAPASGAPTGNVTVSDGAASCTATVAAGSCPLTSSSSGTKTITASYDGDTNFIASTSGGVSHTVNPSSTTTTITNAASLGGTPSVVGQAVSINFAVAAVAPGSGTPTGSVTVSDGLGDSCSASATVGSCSITFPAPGAKTLSAVYAGDANFTGSTSANASHTVSAAATTTTITAHTPAPSVIGQPITVNFTVTVNAPGSGTIPGADNVTVSDGTGDTCSGTVAAGTCQLTATTPGAKTLVATFAGDTNFALSTSTGVSHTVNKRATSSSVSLSPNTVVVGQASSATVTVSDTDTGTQTNPTGTVTLSSSDVGDTFGTCTLSPSGPNLATCTASVTPSKVGTSPHTITATFPADTTHATSNGTASLAVNKANTTTTITLNTPNPSTAGQAVTVNYAVTVDSPGTGAPTGNVTVSDGTGDSCSASVAAGSCQITIGTAGTKTLTATYTGDANFLTSNSTGTNQSVNPKLVVTSTALAILTGTCSSQVMVQTQNANGSAFNEPAISLNLSSSAGTGKFFSDANCSSQVTSVLTANGGSTAGFFYSDTSIGSPIITIASTGLTSVTQTEAITGLRFSTAAFSAQVGQCSTALALQSANAQTGSPTSLTQATAINFASTSAGGKFYSDAACTAQISSTVIGNGFDANHDSPNFFYKDTLAGTPTVSASAGTASATQQETITKATPTFTVPASQSISYGTPSVTLSGTLAAGGLFPPSGESVSIVINGVTTTATIGAGGTFSAIVNTSAIPASGTPYSIAYSYAGDTNFNSATNNSTELTVNKASTSTAVLSSLNPSFSGQQVTFSATVTVSNGVPTGTVQFQDGGVNLGSASTLGNNGGVFTAQLQTSALAVGSHNITAIYNGDTNFSGSSSLTLAQVVKSAATTTSISAPTITYGADGLVTVTVAAQDPAAGTPTGNVSLSVDGSVPVSQPLISGSATFTVSNPNAGDHSLSATYAAQNNFNASGATGNLHVNQALAVLAFGTTTFTFDGSSKPVTVTTTPPNLGVVSITYDGSATAPTNASSYALAASLSNSNYTATPISGTETIQPAGVAITITDPMPTYDGQPHTAAILVNPSVQVTVTYNGSGLEPSAAGSYAVAVMVTNTNYAGTGGGTLTIKQAPLTVTANDKMRTYGAGNPIFDGTITGIVNNDPITATYSSIADLSSPAGTYDITPALSDAGTGTLANYAVTNNKGTLTITAIPLYVVANDKSRNFGGGDPPFDAQYFGFVNGENAGSLSGTLVCTSNSNATSPAGSYAIHCGGLTSTNYSIHFVDGTLAINDPLSSIAVSPNAPHVTYGGMQAFAAQGTFASAMSRTLGNAGGAVYELNPSSVVRTGTAAAEADGKLYVIGGVVGGAPTKVVEVYDPMTNAAPVAVASMANARTNARAISVAGKVYVIGGCSNAACTSLSTTGEVFDPTSSNWSPISTSGFTPRSSMAVGVINGKIYAAGGNDGAGNGVATVEVYDPAADSWNSAPSTTVSLGPATGGVINGKFYVVGVSSGNASLQAFDGTHWSAVSAPAQSLSDAGAAVLNDVLYVFDGANVHAYDPATNTWSDKASLNTARLVPQPVTIGNLIYVADNDSSGTTAVLESFATDEVKWTSSDTAVAPVDQSGKASAAKVGTAQITATSTQAPAFSGSATMTVDPATVTPNVTVHNKIYDGNTSATIVTETLTGVLNNDDVQLTGGTAMFIDKNVGTGKTVNIAGLGLTGTASGNYLLSSSTATATADITPRTLTVMAHASNKTYDGNANATATLSDDHLGSDVVTVTFTGATFSDKNVGTGKTITVSGLAITGGADQGNYTLNGVTQVTTTADIRTAPLAATLIAADKTYDGTNTEPDASMSCSLATVVAGDMVTCTPTSGTFNTSQVLTADHVTATVTISGTAANNYTLGAAGTSTNSTSATATAHIKTAPLTATLTAGDKTYDGTNAEPNSSMSCSFNGVLASDGSNLTCTASSGTFNSKDVATANLVAATVTIGGTAAGNYTLGTAGTSTNSTSATATAHIKTAPLTATLTAGDKTYDGTNAEPNSSMSCSFNGVLASDGSNLTCTASSGTFNSKDVATANQATATVTIGGAAASNYTLGAAGTSTNSTSATATAHIKTAPLTATLSATDKTYDGTTTESGTNMSCSLATVFGVDVVSCTASNGTFNSKDVATANQVSATVTIGGTAAGNYTLGAAGTSTNSTSATATAHIKPAPLSITANNSTKLLDAPNPAFSATYSGFVNGEDPSVLSGALNCTTTATTTSPVGSYPITCSGQTSSNYAITYQAGTLKIVYASGGICDGDAGHQILQPINADGTSVFNGKSTSPAKFRVCDVNGISIGTPGVVANFNIYQILSGTAVSAVDEDVYSTTPDTMFRWDPTGQQWIFNINNKSYPSNKTYFFRITLNDGTAIIFNYGLK